MTFTRRAHPDARLSLFESEWTPPPEALLAIELSERGLRAPFLHDDIESILSLLSSHTLPSFSSESTVSSRPAWRYSPQDGTFSCTVKAPESLEALPKNVGVKGGVARSLLLSILGIPSLTPRDIDLIRKGSFNVPLDEELARTYMFDDYRFGARVELFDSVTKHLGSRDITINEVMYINGVLTCTPFAILDALTLTLRPSRYRGGTLSRPPQLLGRVLLKLLRLRAEMTFSGTLWRVVGIPEDVTFGEFDLALHVEKSLQRSTEIAESFLDHVHLAGFLGHIDGTFLMPVLEELVHLTIGDSAVIRSIPEELATELQKSYSLNFTDNESR